jgi:hypothetical protein
MARRRFISTSLSTDPVVNRLALEHGDFAALLFTWLIPHVNDDGSFKADPHIIWWTVAPGFRWKKLEEIQAALDGMLALGLLTRSIDGRRYFIPAKYVKDRRMSFHGHVKWRRAVLLRDGFRCQRCGVEGGKLHAHHVLPWASYPDQRTDIDNGLTLCEECHRAEHRKAER